MLKLVQKDLKLFFTDKRAMLITFVVPIVLITMFAMVFGGIGREPKTPKAYDLTIADLDNTASSQSAISKLGEQKSIHVIPEKLEVAREAIQKGKKDAVLIFQKGFADSLAKGKVLPVELQYDEAQETQVFMLQRALYTTIAMIRFGNGPGLPGGHTFNSEPGIKMTKLVAAKESNSLGIVQAVAGTAIMMLLFSVAGMGASLLDEKQEGTLKRLLYSSLPPNMILYGKLVYVNLVSIMQLSIMFIWAGLVFGLDITHHLPSLIMMILVTAYACSSFGVFLASFAKSRQQVQGLSTLIVLFMSCIGGSMIPVFVMPPFMQKISVISVNYWGIQGFYDIFWRQLPLLDTTFLSIILILFLIGTILNFMAVQLFKKNILKIA